jgi:hypothetical protein
MQAIDKPNFSLVDTNSNIGNSFLALLAYTTGGRPGLVESWVPPADLTNRFELITSENGQLTSVVSAKIGTSLKGFLCLFLQP